MRDCTTLLKIQLFCICCILFTRYFCKSMKKAIKSNWQHSFFITMLTTVCSPTDLQGWECIKRKSPLLPFVLVTPQRPLFQIWAVFITGSWTLESNLSWKQSTALWPLPAVLLARLLPSPAWQSHQALLTETVPNFLLLTQPKGDQGDTCTWIPGIPAAGCECRLLTCVSVVRDQMKKLWTPGLWLQLVPH